MNESDESAQRKILDLKKKIQQQDYIQNAILEIAGLLTESINKGHFLLYERKQSRPS